MATYLYTRVSAKDQNLERQILAGKHYRPYILDENIYSDKQSGKNFERKHYLELKAKVQPGDEIVIEELDRFGRNKEEIKSELSWFKEHKVVCRILDVPTTLIDFNGQEWIFEMINNLLIEVLGTIAEQERIKIRKRQREGIDAAKIKGTKTGVWFGRQKKELPDFLKILKKQKDGEITITEACSELQISRTYWYKLVKEVS